MDAITLLKEDHKTVERLFKEFERSGRGAHKTRERLVQTMVRELAVHSVIEEERFYPAIRTEVEGAADAVLESLEEHHVVKWLLAELDGLDPEAERFEPKVTVLIEAVRNHVREEEDEVFPLVRATLGRRRLTELGDAMARLKTVAATRPHPRAPDQPPANVLVGAISGAVDRARDVLRGTP
jgi:hemerythrin superfamily protein